MTERLQKFLSRMGACSRRQAEIHILDGDVVINNVSATLGDKVQEGDEVVFCGKQIVYRSSDDEKAELILYHKPLGEIVARVDNRGRRTVFDTMNESGRWVNIGRLDFMTTGLLLFSNDGDLAHRLMHPSAGIEREYSVTLDRAATKSDLAKMLEGIELEDGKARFCSIESQDSSGKNFHVCLMRGRNREVRRLFAAQELEVTILKRVRFGLLHLPEDLLPGQWRKLEDMGLLDQMF